LACCALLAVGVANIDITGRPTRTVTKTVEVPVVKVKKVYAPAQVGDGHMTADQCHALHEGERFRNIVARYGWPAGEHALGGDYEYLTYPVSRDPEVVKECQISFFEGGVSNVELDEDGF
jgi:hypothetical protein